MKRWLFILLLPLSVSATNYYVSAGSGSDSNDGLSTSTPFKHISEVCSLSPGDTAFLAGSFPPESTLYNAYYGYCTLYPQTSGTAGNEIVYKNWPDSGRPLIYGYINTCYSSADCFQTTIVNSGVNYIVYDSLETKWGYRGIHISSGSHITVQYCLSYLNTGGNNNNYGNIYLGPGVPTYVTIKGNTLHDAMESLGSPYTTGGFNTGGVYAEIEGWDADGVTYATRNSSLYARHIIVEDNTIYSQGGWGIRLKRMVDSAIVRNNTIYDCTQGMAIGGAGTANQWSYGNVVYDCSMGLVVMNSTTNTKYFPEENNVAFNNTVYNCGNGTAIWPVSKVRTNYVFNNIFQKTNEYTGQATTSGIDAVVYSAYVDTLYYDYNCLYDCSNSGHLARWGSNYANIAAWRGISWSFIYGKDSNSITSDPLLTDPVNGNFTLQEGSPCDSASLNWLDYSQAFWNGQEATVNGIGAFNVYTDGVARDSSSYQPSVDTLPHTPIQRRTGNVKTTGDKVIIE